MTKSIRFDASYKCKYYFLFVLNNRSLNLIYLQEMFVEQQAVSEELQMEESGWTQVPSGRSISELSSPDVQSR
jgi:hypothetical protein